jgi:hypothetical protein
MEDMIAKAARLLAEAEDCDLIGNLATDEEKRHLFRKIAADLRSAAREIRAKITEQSRTPSPPRRPDFEPNISKQPQSDPAFLIRMAEELRQIAALCGDDEGIASTLFEMSADLERQSVN